MQTSYISTYALRNAPRNDLTRLQSELADRTVEVSTARHADVGLALGTGAGRNVGHRVDRAMLTTLMTSNASATARLELTQTALSDVEAMASEMLATLVALPAGENAASTIAIQGRSLLDRLADRLNGSDGRSYLFAGINSTETPFVRYDDGPQAAVEAAFAARFGVAVGDPGAAAITPADMADFIANDLDALFQDPAWGTTWSNASSENVTSRIAPSERVVTSANANEAAMRDLAKAFAMIGGLEMASLTQASRDVLVTSARELMGEAITGVVALKTELGFAEQAIHKANQRMSLAEDVLERTIGNAEGADPAEAKVRIDLLTAQIEMSYAMTGQLARLSILNYA